MAEKGCHITVLVSYVLQRQVTLTNIRQPQKTSAAFMCSQLTGLFSFPTSVLLSPHPTPRSNFIQKLIGHRPNVPFIFPLFIFFLDCGVLTLLSFLLKENSFLNHKKLQLSASLICRGGDGRSNKQLILQKYCLFQS